MMKLNNQKFKNIKLKTSWSNQLRPFISRIRKDIFNIILNYFDFKNKIILDLFCGTGILGIESLSLGAKFCFFNDKNYLNIRNLRINLQKLKIQNFKLYCFDFKKILNFFLKNNIVFNVIFLDPPFSQKSYSVFALNFLNNNFDYLSNLEVIIIRVDFLLDFNNFSILKSIFKIKIKKYSYYYIYILIKK